MENNEELQQHNYSSQKGQSYSNQPIKNETRQQSLKRKKQLEEKAQQLGISKNKLKKMQKQAKWQETKLQKRKQKRQKEKERKKQQKKLLNQSKNEKLSQVFNNQLNEQKQQKLMRKRKDDYREKMHQNLKVIIDLQFYDDMTEKEINSLVKQLSYCHSINRKMEKPFNYILTSVTESREEFIDQKYNGCKWGIKMIKQPVNEAFKAEQLVYLTGDAQEQIQNFEEEKIYIIGGIVDHNRLKKITYDFAKASNIQVKKLPLKNIKLKSNVHLAVNHVWQWMLRKYNGQTWDEALEKVLPERKIQKCNQK